MLSVLYSETAPDPNPFTKWGAGIVLAAYIAGRGLWDIFQLKASIDIAKGSTTHYVHFVGWEAVIVGGCLLCAASWLHFHFFWTQHERLQEHYELPRLCATIGTVLLFCVMAFLLIRKTWGAF
jgi:hypothetical protein